jgi:catechol 2,3-dioxygenase-like lactoylglutathione lyase family enzyme
MSRATEPLYVRYQVPDAARAKGFLEDFGLLPVEGGGPNLFFRGLGDAPFIYEAVPGSDTRFLGAGFRVDDPAHFERLAGLPGSGPVEAATDAPGGGRRVRMRMADGFEIDAVHGATRAAPIEGRASIALNSARAKPRVNRSVRVARTPALVNRLGHFVLHVSDHQASVAWLRERLGLIPSDYMGPPGDPAQAAGTFLRIDAGEHLVDHHCMLVLGTPRPGVHHCSFEVEDMDALMAGHDYLVERGHTLDCGVGRHLLGSQIFDYWRDPFGFRVEHYTDGDVVNHTHRPSIFSGTAEETTQWGARPPADFFE